MEVAILLATYNGEKYIENQIESLENQTDKNFHIYISDDGSTDKTYNIIKSLELKYSNISVLEKHEQTKSSCNNFLYLLDNITADIFLFCDQDDLWHPDHVSTLVNEYLNLTKEDRKKPICIHADLTVVDSNLNKLENSFFSYQQLPKTVSRYFYFIQNNVTGCSMLINNELKKFVFHNPVFLKEKLNDLLMHDSFFAAIANIFGKVIFVDKQIIDYRQHNGNVVGAKKVNSLEYIRNKLHNLDKEKIMLKKYRIFTSFFLTYFDSLLSDKDKIVLSKYVIIDKKSKIFRIYFLIKNRILKYGIKRNIFLFFLI